MQSVTTLIVKRPRRTCLTADNKYLIKKVKKAKFIYNWTLDDYNNEKARNAFFTDLSIDMNDKFPSKFPKADDKLIKSEWYSLRDLFRRADGKFEKTGNLSGLLKEARTEMLFLKGWIVTKASGDKSNAVGEHSDSETEEEGNSCSVVSNDNKNVHESALKSSQERLDSLCGFDNDNTGDSNCSMEFLSEDEDAVLEFVKKESLKEIASGKVENLDTTVALFGDFQSDNKIIEGQQQMLARKNDVTTVKTKVAGDNNKRELFDSQFAINTQKVNNKTEDVVNVSVLMQELSEQKNEANKLEIVKDTVNILSDILFQLPLQKYLLALDIIDNIFEKYYELQKEN